MPLPAAQSLRRALTGAAVPSLDAAQPLGRRGSADDAVLLLPVAASLAEDERPAGAWSVTEAAHLCLQRAQRRATSSDADPVHTVLLVDEHTRDDLVAAVRATGRRRPGGVLLAPRASLTTSAGTARTLAALGLVDAVLVPHPAAVDPQLTSLVHAAGRVVIGPDHAGDSPDTLAEAGRAARLSHVASTPGAWTRVAPRDAPAAMSPSGSARARVIREPRRVVVAGHDLKFAGSLIAHLSAAGHEVRTDVWQGHARHDLDRSRELASWADVVHCEWSLGNLAWYSRELEDPGRTTRLTSRLHLQEAGTPFPRRVRHASLDAWIFVADHVRTQVLRDTGFPLDRTAWIPNAVRVSERNPPHDDGDERRFVIGLVGVLPERKGLHRALDLLSLLRHDEPRFHLRIRGHRPDEVTWMARRPDAAGYYAAQLRRLREEKTLIGAVTWDEHGPNMADWYSRVGVALSVSDFESFHFTLPDGAVHGCVPASLAWPGADLLYPREWLHAGVHEMAEDLVELTAAPAPWRDRAARAHDYIADTYAEQIVIPRLADCILGARSV
ncbi:MAG: hypothetical protein Q4G34_05715 [Micrococcus sp.]|nr:hypothetical protein [Micrococcus sp.]